MTTPSECFKKQVKKNIVTSFDIFIEGTILFWPIVVFVLYWLSLPPASTYDELFDRTFVVGWGGFILTCVFTFIYDYIIAIPILRCFYDKEFFE